MTIELRKNELIEQYVSTHGSQPPQEVILNLRRRATLETRQAKDKNNTLPLCLKMHQWKTRAMDLKLFPREIVKNTTGHEITWYNHAAFTDTAREEIAAQILAHTSAAHPTFSRMNILASAHRLTADIRFTELHERDALTQDLANRALASAVSLTPTRYTMPTLTQEGLTLRGGSVFDREEEKIYTTQEVLDTEAVLMAGATNTHGLHNTNHELTDTTLEQHTSDEGQHLAPDQRQAAFDALTSPTEISAIIGPAGAGKTSTLAGPRAAWEAEHGQDSIIGLAPSAVAAAVLAKELGITTDNTAKWLYESVGDGVALRAKQYQQIQQKIDSLEERLEKDPKNLTVRAALDAQRTRLTTKISEQSKYQIRPGQLVIIDEASMAAAGDLYQIYEQVHAAGGKLL